MGSWGKALSAAGRGSHTGCLNNFERDQTALSFILVLSYFWRARGGRVLRSARFRGRCRGLGREGRWDPCH